jgi:hypothetical protein
MRQSGILAAGALHALAPTCSSSPAFRGAGQAAFVPAEDARVAGVPSARARSPTARAGAADTLAG